MEKYLATLLLTASFSSYADVISSFRAACGHPIDFARTMENHGEFPLIRGSSKRVLEDTPFESTIVVFLNPQTRTFTIAEKINESTICIVAAGDEMEPLDEEGNSLEKPEDLKGT